jgi:hypothetical protein
VDEPIIADSALKHGVARDAILHAFRNPIRAYDVDDGFAMLIGPAPNADLLEIGVVSATEGPVIVHAMRARQRFLDWGVITMPRSTDEILAHAEALAKRFEDFDPAGDNGIGARSLREIRHAFVRRAEAEREISEAVAVARAEGHSWAAIGAMLGTSGEAARQRYGHLART